MSMAVHGGFPKKQGLYDPANEKDSCGVGFICDIKGRPSHQIVADAALYELLHGTPRRRGLREEHGRRGRHL